MEFSVKGGCRLSEVERPAMQACVFGYSWFAHGFGLQKTKN